MIYQPFIFKTDIKWKLEDYLWEIIFSWEISAHDRELAAKTLSAMSEEIGSDYEHAERYVDKCEEWWMYSRFYPQDYLASFWIAQLWITCRDISKEWRPVSD